MLTRQDRRPERGQRHQREPEVTCLQAKGSSKLQELEESGRAPRASGGRTALQHLDSGRVASTTGNARSCCFRHPALPPAAVVLGSGGPETLAGPVCTTFLRTWSGWLWRGVAGHRGAWNITAGWPASETTNQVWGGTAG